MNASDKRGIRPDSNELMDEDVKFLAENSDLSPRQAEQLIAKHGRDRDKLLELARTMKAEG